MNNSTHENIIANNRGETLVEVMVAFIVLMIVLAMFSNTINFGSSAVMHSIETRRTSDNEYIRFHEILSQESRSSSTIEYRNDSNPATIDCGKTGTTKSLKDSTDNDIGLTAYQYRSGDTVYWVFR